MIKKYNQAVFDHVNQVHLKLYDFGYVSGNSRWTSSCCPSTTSQLYFIIGGDQYITIGAERIPVKAGSCCLVPSGSFFVWECETSMENLYFHITLSDISGIDMLKKCGGIMECAADGAVVERLKRYVTSGCLRDSLLLRQELYAALFGLFDIYGFEITAPQYSHEVRQAMEYIGAHLSIQLSVADIAANSFVSVSALSKKFRSELDMTVSEYIENAVMQEAEMLLLNSSLTIQQISEHFDFCYQSYFTRRFKRRSGLTPQQFRKNRPPDNAEKQEILDYSREHM